MAHRKYDQLSLADGLVAPVVSKLDAIAATIGWGSVEAELRDIYCAPEGRQSFPPLMLFKCLLLQQWYHLSDPGLEESLGDRLSFRRFVGLGLADKAPDHSTFCRFRKELERRDLGGRLFAAITGQLEAKGLVVRQGTLIDATLVEAAVKKPDGPGGTRSSTDPDADWTMRGKKKHFGYKGHVAVDKGSGIIRKFAFTDAKTAEVQVFAPLVCGDEAMVYADKGYHSQANHGLLAALGIGDGVMVKQAWGRANRPDPQITERNRGLGKVRSAVERVFGLMKRGYGYRRVRYLGLAANSLHFAMLCIAVNLKRAVALQG
jgi:IS5 family transposase